MLQFIQFVPYLSLKDSLRSYRESIAADEVSLALVAKIGIVLQKSFEAILPRLELPVLIFEHADGASGVYD